jgi:hypothetical protein
MSIVIIYPMTAEEHEFLFGIHDEECTDLPSGPQTDRILRVIRDHPGSTRMEVWNLLPVPRGMNYSAFSNILCALEKRSMIVFDKEGRAFSGDRLRVESDK